MESLLRWSIEHSTPGEGTDVPKRTDLDPAIIDYILGKPDAQLMKEALDVALDASQPEDRRIAAMDDLEMARIHSEINDLPKLTRCPASTRQLVENIDNANGTRVPVQSHVVFIAP